MSPLILYSFLTLNLIWLIALTFLLLKSGKHPSPSVSQVSSAGWRFAIVKFNPFSDTGGEQSFVLSLLNPSGSGILVTSLHSRDKTRLYAKEIVNGKADLELSAEEKEALVKAQSFHA